jgi:hypothetical protein
MPTRELIPQTRRERQVNYGTTTEVTGSGEDVLVAFDEQQARGVVIYVEPLKFTLPAGAVGTADFRPFVRVRWGHGAASVEAEFDCTHRQRIPIAASDVEVVLFIKSLPFPGSDGTRVPVPPLAFLKARAFAATEIDGVQLYPTVWGTQLDQAEGIISDEPARLTTLRAFNPGEALVYLLVFDEDALPSAGDVPFDALPLPPATANLGIQNLPLGQGRAFVNGITWALSSTPFALTAAGGAIFLSFELES